MTKFIFIRHGEPDYPSTLDWCRMPLAKNFAGLSVKGVEQIKKSAVELKKYDAKLIVSSPFTRSLQTAAIIAAELGLDVSVEHNLYEWQADLSYTIEDEDILTELVNEYKEYKGIYPKDEQKIWESKESVRQRVLGCLEKYKNQKCVIVAGHGMMIQAVAGRDLPTEYGQIVEIDL